MKENWIRVADFDYTINRCLEICKIIKRCKEQSKHDGHPKCYQCNGEGYAIEMPSGKAVNCPCKWNPDYIKILERLRTGH